MKIVILDSYAANPGDLTWQPLAGLGELTCHDNTTPGQVTARAAGAEIVLTNKVVINAGIIDALPQLRYVGVLATGYNVVDIQACHQRGITVTNVPAYSTPSVAQMVMAHLLEHTNAVGQYTSEIRKAGAWTRSPQFCYYSTPVTELAGKVMGIVGLGNIGQAVTRLALALGMRVLALTSKSQDTLPQGVTKAHDLAHLLRNSDVVSLHCPLCPDTHHLINASTLQLMKPTALLINTGRGPLVDEAALADALRHGTIAGAGVDVLAQEPPAAGNPLLTAPNCTITPHIAWASLEARTRLLDTAISNVRAFIQGHPVNVC